MAVQSFELAWISVSDIAKARKFFVDTLGMKIVSDHSEFNWLEVEGQNGGARIGIGSCGEQSPLKPGNNAVISLTVDDIVATKKMLEGKGVTIIGDIMEVPGQVKLLLIQDLDKNLIHLCQKIS
ncbi:MAG TPA: VOC family protein [Candidatus Babeliales bacterium]|jgi:predicted enzyme related to lactoylglutathione lyase|nr:VOC family protein [Candidatus Babeliales bacterium]